MNAMIYGTRTGLTLEELREIRPMVIEALKGGTAVREYSLGTRRVVKPDFVTQREFLSEISDDISDLERGTARRRFRRVVPIG